MSNPNVILITIDGLRADHLHCYGYSRNTSPTIDALASRGAVFKNAFSHGGGSPEAFPSLHAATLPPTTADQYGSLLEQNTTLAEMLRAKGYETAGFVDANAFLSKYFHFDKGFDYFYDGLSDETASRPKRLSRLTENSFLAKRMDAIELLMRTRPVTTAEEINKKALSWLSERKGRFFVWVHYMDTHRPFLPSRKNQKEIGTKPMNYYSMLLLQRKAKGGVNMMNDSELKKFISLYDGVLRNVDNGISRLLAELGSRGMLQNTLIVLTADHGTNLGENGLMSHGSVYESVIRIPLIFNGPGIISSTFEKPVTSLGIRDTVVNLVQETSEVSSSAFEPLRRSIIEFGGVVSTMVDTVHNSREISFRTEKWKYIRMEDLNSGSRKAELYDLEVDPKEQTNIFSQHEKECSVYEAVVQNFVKKSAMRFQDSEQWLRVY
jgi:arylsulfatase A-like enzyme